jgi:hypothetical protein
VTSRFVFQSASARYSSNVTLANVFLFLFLFVLCRMGWDGMGWDVTWNGDFLFLMLDMGYVYGNGPPVKIDRLDRNLDTILCLMVPSSDLWF